MENEPVVGVLTVTGPDALPVLRPRRTHFGMESEEDDLLVFRITTSCFPVVSDRELRFFTHVNRGLVAKVILSAVPRPTATVSRVRQIFICRGPPKDLRDSLPAVFRPPEGT